MKVIKNCFHGLSWVIIFMLMIPTGIMAQDSGQTVQPTKFEREELAQMLAPIALYPDLLIAEILMASTYPIEVVEAERWINQNKDLKGDELDKALQEKTWDSSVKSLCHFPEVISAMSDKLEQTARLGDAFLSQPDDVMDTIQELRREAQEQGNLKTTKEQKVIVEKEIIEIEPASPQVIYIPVYDPLYVYGPWWYPAYPPYYWYYPPGAVFASGIIGFGPGIFIGFGISPWCWFDWHHHHIYTDIRRTIRFNRFGRGKGDFNRHVWRHNPYHRRGVAYRDRATSQRFGKPFSHYQGIKSKALVYANRYSDRQIRGPFRSIVERRTGLNRTSRGIYRERVQRESIRGRASSGVGNRNFEYKATKRWFSNWQSGELHSGGNFRSLNLRIRR
jgi:hypothetical protein